MKHAEAEKLLGGYATGTLTEDERRRLFAAALGHQDIFDALMDEEALRELLMDPAARAQLLAALAPVAAPRSVPFWRRTGVLAAAASLIVAATAGLVYLRSPQAPPPLARQEAVPTPEANRLVAPTGTQAQAPPAAKALPVAPLREKAKSLQVPTAAASATPTFAPQLAGAVAIASAREDSARARMQDAGRREAQDNLAKKSEAETPRPVAAAVMEVIAPMPQPAPAAKATAGGSIAQRTDMAAFAPAPRQASAPVWMLEPQPDGATQVTVTGPRRAQLVLLKRGASGVEVLPVRESRSGVRVQWRCQVRLVAGDVLDLYLLDSPVADPASLPAEGPVDGFRARIYPAAPVHR